MVPALVKLSCKKKALVLDFCILQNTSYLAFLTVGSLKTDVDRWGWASNVRRTQNRVPLLPLTSFVTPGKRGLCPRAPRGLPGGTFCMTWGTAVSDTGFFWQRGHAVPRCQLLVLPATGFDLCSHFSWLILLIKESQFSIMLNQELFIVQETIKTLMGHDWPRLPLWPYLFTACIQHLCC